MDDLREKVIRGLECCILHDPDDKRRCSDCPYDHHEISNAPCANGLKFEALSLLKAQEPRLLTEADFVNADHYGYMPAWAEEKNGDQFWKIVRVASLGLEKKRLRYWTSRPTDEQREATPWNQ